MEREEPDFPVPVKHRVHAFETRDGLILKAGTAVTPHETGVRIVSDNPEEVDRQAERIRARLAERGVTFRESRRVDDIQLTVRVPLPTEGGDVYGRVVLKAAAAYTPVVLGEDWLETEQAAHIRNALWISHDARRELDLGFMEYPCSEAVQAGFSAPNLHVLSWAPAEDGMTAFTFAMFGRVLGGVEVLREELPMAEHPVILVDPVHDECARARLIEFAPFQRLISGESSA